MGRGGSVSLSLSLSEKMFCQVYYCYGLDAVTPLDLPLDAKVVDVYEILRKELKNIHIEIYLGEVRLGMRDETPIADAGFSSEITLVIRVADYVYYRFGERRYLEHSTYAHQAWRYMHKLKPGIEFEIYWVASKAQIEAIPWGLGVGRSTLMSHGNLSCDVRGNLFHRNERGKLRCHKREYYSDSILYANGRFDEPFHRPMEQRYADYPHSNYVHSEPPSPRSPPWCEDDDRSMRSRSDGGYTSG